MLDLLKKGFSTSEIARLQAFFDSLKSLDKQNLRAVEAAKAEWSECINIGYNKARMGLAEFVGIAMQNYGMDIKQCSWSGGFFPIQLLVDIPDERGRDKRYALADLLLSGEFEYEYSSAGKVIKIAKLYGDRNILNYTTNPLDHLKFRCLPNEKLACNLIEDPEGDDECSGNAPVFLGVELEVERKDSTPKKIEHMVIGDLGMDYAILKSDSSVPAGFEIVTAPATIGFHLKAWDKFFENSAKHLTSYASGRCGMHVHVSRKSLTPMHLGKLVAFINNNENRAFLTTIAGRNSANYAAYDETRGFHVKSKLVSHIADLTEKLTTCTDEKEKKALEAQLNAAKARVGKGHDTTNVLKELMPHNGAPRHVALNLQKDGTVELRIFRGNVSKIGMLKNLEFTHAAVEFTREATFRTRELNEKEKAERKLKRKENTDYALHYTYFIDWLEKDTTGNYNNLKLWLSEHKMTKKYVKPKQTDKTPVDKRTTSADIVAAA